MLSVIMLSVIMLSVIMLSVIMLSVIILSGIKLKVVAPSLNLIFSERGFCLFYENVKHEFDFKRYILIYLLSTLTGLHLDSKTL